MDKMTMTSEQQQTNGTTALAKPGPVATTENSAAMNPFASGANFDVGQRMAMAISRSSTIPKDYQGNVANCLVALEMAARIGATPLAVMQNLHIIHGRPSWSASFLIAALNTSKRFGPVRFRWEEKGEPTSPANCQKRGDTFGCRAVAKDLESGEECVGALVSWSMVRAEKWDGKPGSKWLTMPEQMFMYRAAAFFSRVYAPELSLGMQTHEEVIDTVGYEVPEKPARVASTSLQALEETILGTTPTVPKDVPSEPASGPRNVAVDDDGVVSEHEEG
jgi:hypothetical protein